MTKKIYNAPYFKVVEVENNIIATSPQWSDNGKDAGDALIQGRHSMWDDDFDGEDVF